MPRCAHCEAALGQHHVATCVRWGQVLPSECAGYLEGILLTMKPNPPKRN